MEKIEVNKKNYAILLCTGSFVPIFDPIWWISQKCHVNKQKQKKQKYIFTGTVQRKLAWVKSGINRKLMIWAWAAWGLFYILRGLGP
jgi:hypothetical protein